MSPKLSMAMEPAYAETAAGELQLETENLEVDSIETDSLQAQAWVMATKPVGAFVAGWQIIERFEDKTRTLVKSERCQVTSFCYPAGAKLVEAILVKAVDEHL